jgi:hypothetical protein
MIDYAVSLPDRDARLRCAQSIVKLMETKVPQLRDNANYQQTLWDHLYLMSGKQLDIDWPFDISEAQKISTKPEPLAYPMARIPVRHYGKMIFELFEKLKTMEAGPERDELVRMTANQMKQNLLQWSHGSADDEKVADDLARFTDGKIQLDLSSFRMNHVQAINNNEPKRSKKRK